MFKTFASISVLAITLCLPSVAHAQISEGEIFEATSDILGAQRTAFQIRQLRDVPSVGVFYIQGGSTTPFNHLGDRIASLGTFAEKNAYGVDRLRHALVANPVTRRTMADHGVDVGRVVGVSIGSTGSLRFFVE